MSAFARFVYRFPYTIDRIVRRFDFKFHRVRERGFLAGHSSLAFWLPIPVILFAAYGLPAWRGWLLAAFCLAALAGHWLACRIPGGRRLAWLQWAIVVAVALGVWGAVTVALRLGAPEPHYYDPRPYRLVYGPLAAVALSLALPIGRWWGNWLLGDRRAHYRQLLAGQLSKTSLFVRLPESRDDNLRRVLRAYFLAPIESPLLLAVLPSIAVLLLPRLLALGLSRMGRPISPSEIVWWVFALALLPTWALLAAVNYNPRLRAFRMLLRQAFLVGLPLVLSLVVILLAVARLGGVDYVTTVLDQSSGGVVLGGLAALYLLFWLYDYWTQRAAAELLLGMLYNGSDPYPWRIDYRPNPVGAPRPDRLQIHGAGRFIAISERPRSDYKEAFESYQPLDLVDRIHRQLVCRAGAGEIDWDTVHEVGDAVAELRQKSRIYVTVPALVLAGLIGLGVYSIYQRQQEPGLVARSPAPAPALTSLGESLRRADPSRPVYAVAVSGGGTRAALYAYSVLRAVHAGGAGDRVVLVSSVSGGSLSAAYYAGFRHTLKTDADWLRYRRAMAAPYIGEVLSAAGAWRFTTGARLGQALTESFERCFYGGELDCGEAPAGGIETLGEAGGDPAVGFVFNVSVGGTWHADDPAAVACADALAGRLRERLHRGVAAMLGREREVPPRRCATVAEAGTRLAVTNVLEMTPASVATPFPEDAAAPCGPAELATEGCWPLDFEYAVARDPATPLSAAASLSANFPPVFSNAAVDILDKARSRYFTTDGGAVENRGLVSALLALRAALRELGAGRDDEVPLDLPPMRVLMAEASGFSVAYAEDRGTGAKFGAARQLANKLIGELLDEVDGLYRDLTGGRAGVEIFYLQMPEALIDPFGTHWEMPFSGASRDPRTWYLPPRRFYRLGGAASLELKQAQLLEVMDALFDRDRRRLTGIDGRLWEWIASGRYGDPIGVLESALATSTSDSR